MSLDGLTRLICKGQSDKITRHEEKNWYCDAWGLGNWNNLEFPLRLEDRSDTLRDCLRS